MPLEEKDSYSEEELGGLDLGKLFEGGIRTAEGRLRGELMGEGSVAAAVQLEAAGVMPEEVGHVVRSLRESAELPEGPEALLAIVRRGLSVCEADEDRVMLARWLANVATLMVVRRSSGSRGPA